MLTGDIMFYDGLVFVAKLKKQFTFAELFIIKLNKKL